MIVALVVLTAARALLFAMPGVRFDADQAVVGLMAKHISEGRAFPLFFYGQSYLLALEAYLAAPLMWLLGPTELALKLPLVAMNVTTAVLAAWCVHRDLGLRPWLAGLCALPLALPPIVAGTRLMEAMGGNAELPLYALLFWVVRSRPWAFAAVAALAIVHRELAIYPLAALAAIEIWRGAFWTQAGAARWGLVAVGIVAVRTLIEAVRPFAAMYGPDTVARSGGTLDISSAAAVGAQLCADPTRWAGRLTQLAGDHWPLLVGGAPGPLNLAGVTTGIGQGHPGLGLWVAGLSAAGLLLALGRRAAPPSRGDAAPAADFGWYLAATGATSVAAYWLVACSQITLESFRYDLLALLLPVGAVMVGARHAAAPARAGLATATVIWVGLVAGDYRALAGEIAAGRYPDYRGQAITALEARGLTALWGEFRLAHVLTFRAQERVIVSALDRERIDLYAARARAANGPVVTMQPCPDGRGELLVPTIYLCPRR